MALEIRPHTPDEEDAFRRVPSIVFGNYNPNETPPPSTIRPEWTLAAFEDGVLATTYGAYPFRMFLNGKRAPVAGVTVVGTLPHFRRRGHLRAIMAHDFKRRYEERMEPVAVLLASIAAIYQRYGYAICSSKYRVSVDPKWIDFAPSMPPATGRWRDATRDELPLLQSMYDEFSQPRNGYLYRAPIVWDLQVLNNLPNGPAPAGPNIINVYEEAGEPKGYITWAPKWHNRGSIAGDDGPEGQRIFIRDLIWLTPGAYRAAWEMFRTFDLASRISWDLMPIDDPAFNVLLDPRELHATRGDWLLGRIIDVERALPARAYNTGGRVTFELRDEMCPWNADRWALEVGPEGAAMTRTKESPQLTLDVSALVQLLFGHLSATQSVRYGRAEASPDAPLALWDALFRTEYAPFCPDGF